MRRYWPQGVEAALGGGKGKKGRERRAGQLDVYTRAGARERDGSWDPSQLPHF